jgi:hypothetical protein
MELHLERLQCGRDFTIGTLSIDGDFQCWTLEDELRPPGVKVPAQTCIPPGRYRVNLTFSNRFQRMLPLLVDVPDFAGIRIHPGNTSADTEGCILVGLDRHGQSVGRSRDAFSALFAKLSENDRLGRLCWITVDNGVQTPPRDTP